MRGKRVLNRGLFMNQGFVAGRLGADPEVRFTSSGQKVTTFRVGARVRKDETIWWRVTVWGEQFDKIISYLKKGSAVMVVGEIAKPEIFTDKEGKPQISMGITANSIQFSPFGKSDGTSQTGSSMSPLSASVPFETESVYATIDAASGEGRSDAPFSDEDMPF